MWPFSSLRRVYPEIPHEKVDGKEFDYIVVGGMNFVAE